MSTDYERKNKGNGKLLTELYKVECKQVPNSPGTWNSNTVEIFKLGERGWNKIGEYTRNYPALYGTFLPFEQDGKHYALYSRDYTATRVMSLPDCKDICGEEPETADSDPGFCPTGYYVPHDPQDGLTGQFGFVCGCYWGDDSGGWKVQFLDLSRIAEGTIKRDERLGYIQMPYGGERLIDAIEFGSWDGREWKPGQPVEKGDYASITVRTLQSFDLNVNYGEPDRAFKTWPGPWKWSAPGFSLWHHGQKPGDPEADDVPILSVNHMIPPLMHVVERLPKILRALGATEEGRYILDEIYGTMKDEYIKMVSDTSWIDKAVADKEVSPEEGEKMKARQLEQVGLGSKATAGG